MRESRPSRILWARAASRTVRVHIWTLPVWAGEAGESAGEESLSPALDQRLTWEEREDRRWLMEAGVRPWEEGV